MGDGEGEKGERLWGRDRAPGPSSGTQRGPGGTTTIYTVLLDTVLLSILYYYRVLQYYMTTYNVGLGGSRRVSAVCVLTVFGTSASVPCSTNEGRVSKV